MSRAPLYPGQPMLLRALHCPAAWWERAAKEAKARGLTASDVMRGWIEAGMAQPPPATKEVKQS